MNSHEHSDIRRSVHTPEKDNLERLSSDKFVIRRDQNPSDDSSTEVVGDSTSVPDKFDQPSYDFMLPEGKAEKSTILAVVDFITRKHNVKPTFIVNFDENDWFDIGFIEKTTADNADVYKATVILKAGANVDILKTDNGIYRFVVEAQQGDVVLATTNISVEVLSLAPTTKRVKVTIPSEPKLLETTTMTMEIEEDSEFLTLGSGVFSSTSEVLTSSQPEESKSTSSEISTSSTFSSTTSEPEESENPTSSQILTSSSLPSTTSEHEEAENPTSSEVLTSDSENSESEEEVEVFDASGDSEGSAESESSGEASSENSEDPISGPISILPLKSTENGEIEPIEAHLDVIGSPEIRIPRGSRIGDVIRNFHVEFRRGDVMDELEFMELSMEPTGIFEIRPKFILANEKAQLFLKIQNPESLILKNSDIQIIGKLGNSTFLKTPISLKIENENLENSEGSEMISIGEIEFGILESAESGRTVGSVGGDLRILGGNGVKRFSLVGNDLILTCGQFETDKCLQNDIQKTFTLILMPKNGTLAPIQVTIQVQQTANLRTSDKVIRISDNRIISPFAVITERTRKNIKLDGDAAKFLGFVKAQDGLYQIIVVNSAASGRYSLEISLDDVDSSESPLQKIDVFVENSQSHAHFRKSKYEVKFDAKNVKRNLKLSQVELEGVPIDEAKIMILDGNPGWITVEDYGGIVKIGKFDGEIYNGIYQIRIAAVDKKTWTILTETLLEVQVQNGAEPQNRVPEKLEKPSSKVLSVTFDREKTEQFKLDLESENFKLDPKSMYGIDEKGLRTAGDPTSITITKNVLNLNSDSLKSLRILGFSLKSQNGLEKVSVLIRLISSPEYLETVKKLAARPEFPDPWTRENPIIHVELREELAPGQVVGVFPAIGRSEFSESSNLKTEISGEMRDAFDFDESTGELKIRQRIDFENLDENQKTFDLKLTSGEKGFESEAILRVKVLDVDDNSPMISYGDVEQVSLPENVPAGTKIAEFDVTDPDGSPTFDIELGGSGKTNFRANMTSNCTLGIFVSENANIDRELQDSQNLIVKVSDISGNADQIILPIRILDVNDNSPEFSQKMYEVEVVEDWPRGMQILKVDAEDVDSEGSHVEFLLTTPSGNLEDNFVSINATSGIISISEDLFGRSRDAPYRFDVIARDSGTPPLNSTAILSLRILSKNAILTRSEVEMEQPRNGMEIMVKENTPLDTKIFTAKANLRGIPSKIRGDLIYTIKDLLNDFKDQTFAIDKSSGDIFVVKPIDYEKSKEFTVLISATSSENEDVTSSRILKIRIENLDDNEPEFLESPSPLFEISRNTFKPTAIGRITAYDKDSHPIFYYLIPKCGSPSNFSIDQEFGEIIYSPKSTPDSNISRIELCFVAKSRKMESSEIAEIFFDATAKNMRKVILDFVDQDQKLKMEMFDFIGGNQSISRIGDVLDRVEIPMQIQMTSGKMNEEYKLEDLQFIPANYELGRDMISPEGAVGLNAKTGELVANGKIVDTPQGVYIGKIQKASGSMAVKKLHHIRNDRKLRYVVSMSRNEFGANLEKFKRQIIEAAGKLEDSNNLNKKKSQLDIQFDEPIMDVKNSNWTSVCFYLTRDNAILSDKQATSLISSSNGHISKLHHIFKVVNVDACSPMMSSRNSASSESDASTSSSIPLNTLILIGVVGILIIALIGLSVYVCCVSKYQRYLKMKTERMRSSSSTGSYYKSPNLIPPPPPGYIHTPPLPPPPPAAAIAYY